MFNKKPYSVSSDYLEGIVNEEILVEVKKVISEYDKTIKYLEKNTDFTKYKYEYYNSHEEITCSDIFKVYETVMARQVKKD